MTIHEPGDLRPHAALAESGYAPVSGQSILEQKPNRALSVVVKLVAFEAKRLPADHALRQRTLAVLGEARDILDRVQGGQLSYFNLESYKTDLRRAKELRVLLEQLHSQLLSVASASPMSVNAKSKIKPGQYADEQGMRQRFDTLVTQRQQVTEQLASWRSLFQRPALEEKLQRLDRDIKAYRTKFPFVATLRDLKDKSNRATELVYQAERRTPVEYKVEDFSYLGTPAEITTDSVKKELALRRANLNQELSNQPVLKAKADQAELRALNRPDYERALQRLQTALANPPSRTQNYDSWYTQCINDEATLNAYASLGVTEQNQVAAYWRTKVEVLAEIKPVFFGRSRWQQEFERATTARRTVVGQSLEQQLKRAA